MNFCSQPPPTQHVDPYIPLPGVIEQNELFDFALKAAPNVLYSRYKQYGQVHLPYVRSVTCITDHPLAWRLGLVL